LKSIRKMSIACAAMAMAFCMILTAIPQVAALFGKKDEEATVSTFSKWNSPGETVVFSPDEFTSRVNGDSKLVGLIISELPEQGAGMLLLAGKEVFRGQEISLSRVSELSFIPGGEGDVHTSIGYFPVFKSSGTGSDQVSVAINVSEKENMSPVAVNVQAETYTDLKVRGEFRAVDVDGDACTFQLVKAPSKGEVTVDETGFLYTPSGKNGEDKFTYIALDSFGNPSKAATVTVAINKRPNKEALQYVDMENSASHYGAIKVAEAGIFVGESISGKSFLYPDTPVSRTEFVAMVAALTELPMPTASVSTGLADNNDIPVWAQSFVVSAVSSGVVYGEKNGEGNRVFRASDAITRAEAACILDRALKLTDEGSALTALDAAEVPDWALQPVINTTSTGILPVFSDSSVKVNEAVTRKDAVDMLYQSLKYLNQNGKSGGILGLFR